MSKMYLYYLLVPSFFQNIHLRFWHFFLSSVYPINSISDRYNALMDKILSFVFSEPAHFSKRVMIDIAIVSSREHIQYLVYEAAI